jgi:hypothetical protein
VQPDALPSARQPWNASAPDGPREKIEIESSSVEANLAGAYRKLGIRSRAQLAAALAAHESG